MRFLIILILAMFTVSVKGTAHTYDIFTVKNNEDKTCFVYENGTTEDQTKSDLDKCKIGCGGSFKVIAVAKKNNRYSFSHYKSEDCSGTADVSADFLCPTPSSKAFDIEGTDFNMRCGTKPKASYNDDDDVIEDAGKGKGKGKGKPSDENNTKTKPDENEIPSLSEDIESSDAKPKSKGKEGNSADEETDTAATKADNGSLASTTGASIVLLLISLIASLSL